LRVTPNFIGVNHYFGVTVEAAETPEGTRLLPPTGPVTVGM
jgi:hypothetical protein